MTQEIDGEIIELIRDIEDQEVTIEASRGLLTGKQEKLYILGNIKGRLEALVL